MSACRNCSEARSSAKASLHAILDGNLKQGAAKAKEAAGHIAAKAKDEAARVRGLLTRKPS